MKPIFLSVAFLFLTFLTAGQSLQSQVAKPTLDTGMFGRWPSAQLSVINADGNYALYIIHHQPMNGTTLVIRSLKNNWRKEIVNALNASFTDNGRRVVFIDRKGRLCLLELGSDSMDFVAETSSYRLVKQGVDEWLVYQLSNEAKELNAVNLKTKQEKSFTGVDDYWFSSDGSVLVLLKQSDADHKLQVIEWVNFPTGNAKDIWNGNGATNFVMNKIGDQLAFVVETKSEGNAEKSIFYYRTGKEKAELLAGNHTKGIDSNLFIDGIYGGFSNDDDKLFINLKEKKRFKPKEKAVMMDVWSYQDVKLQTMQLLELSQSKLYIAAIWIKDHQVIRLQQPGDRDISIVGQWPNKVYASQYSGDLLESHWNVASQKSFYFVSTYNGERQKLNMEPRSVSPSGKYIVGEIAHDKDNIYCYNTLTGKIRNITHLISAPFDKVLDDNPTLPNGKWLETANWLKNDEGVLVNDRYDLWLVDANGIKSPVNLTNGYGQKSKIVFRLPEVYWYKSIGINSKIILKGFNRISKEGGLYEIQIGKQEDPILLTKGCYQFEIPDNPFNSAQLDLPNSQHFLVRRESATQSPNYFLTKDFKIFTAITNEYPESSFNWLTSELHTWKSPNGKSLQGVLYKPQNFDPNKKYPVIFHYYQRMSDQLHKFLEPRAITDHLNIPWFVSNGYLVFTPDIHYEIGKTGESALNSVVSGARYLKKFPWVDAKRMGLQGQSFGGFETNYIVTHSNLFAAAMSSAGFSDCVSDYNGISHWGRSRQHFYEIGQNRIKATLWESPELYVRNSPIFNAHNVTTPVLMMHNKDDGGVPFAQGIEFFTSLRRLGKRAWLLQYDDGDHVLTKNEDALQHTIRITQFFDHYLKDSAAPKWMLYGIPAKMKGIDDGLELVREKDPTTGKWITPKEGGLLTDEEKKKVEALKRRKPITITLD